MGFNNINKNEDSAPRATAWDALSNENQGREKSVREQLEEADRAKV